MPKSDNNDSAARLVLADSHEIVREGIAARLMQSCDIEIVGQADDGYNTIKLCRKLKPDMLIMDMSLTRPSGKETFTKIRESVPETKILILSSDASPVHAFSMLSNGAAGFMPKQAKSVHFVAAVNSISLGYTSFNTEYMSEFFNLRNRVKRSGNVYGLSEREIEVLVACCDGRKSSEVAELLSISVRTVETHRNSIYRKTSCRDMKDLAKIAVDL